MSSKMNKVNITSIPMNGSGSGTRIAKAIIINELTTHEAYQNIPYAVFFIAVAVASIILNGGVLVTFRAHKAYHTKTHKILASFIFSCLLFGATVSPLSAVTLLTKSFMRNHILAATSLNPIFVVCTSNCLVFYAFERCLYILTESNYQMHRKTLYSIMALAYFVPACSYVFRLLHDLDMTFVLLVNVQIIISYATMILMFGAVISSLNRYTKNENNANHEDYTDNTRDARTVIMILITHMLFNFPLIIRITAHDDDPDHFKMLFSCFSSVFAPATLILRNSDLYKRVFQPCKSKKRANDVVPSQTVAVVTTEV